MNADCFFDTNVLVYCFDGSSEKKHEAALKILERAVKNKTLFISTQSLQEVVNVFAKKKKYSEKTVTDIVNFLAAQNVYEIKIKTILLAKSIMYKSKLSFWDSLVIAAAKETGCSVLLSEDLNAGQIVEGVKIQNPFLEE